jgi:hypothetical protein
VGGIPRVNGPKTSGWRIGRLVLLALTVLGFTTHLRAETTVWNPTTIPLEKAIVVGGGNVASWEEGPERIVLLQEKAIVEQGNLKVQAKQIYLRINIGGYAQSGQYGVRFIAEGDVVYSEGNGQRETAMLRGELLTRNEVRIEARNKKIARTMPLNDIFVQRAQYQLSKAIGANNATHASPIQQVSATQTSRQQPAPADPPVAMGPIIPQGNANPVAAPARILNIAPRTSAPFQVGAFQMPNGEQVIVVTGGVLLTIRNANSLGLIDIEAEQLIFWTKSEGTSAIDQLRSADGMASSEQEFYLAGDVQIRNRTGPQERKLRAEQVYYDVKRNVAVARSADLELKDPKLPEVLHLRADEVRQLGPKKFEADQAEVFSSRLPSDPGLKVVMTHASLEDFEYERKTLFGIPLLDKNTGKPQIGYERLVRGENAVLRLEGVPVFYLPYLQGDANEPLGPLQTLTFRQDRVFGTQVLATFNMYSLFNVDPLPGTRWTLETDYLSKRGPALGTEYQYAGTDLFGLEGPFVGNVKMFGIYDDGTDILGGGRGENDEHPLWRGRVLARHQQRFWENFVYQGQMALISDKNFIEQYFKPEWDTGLNQELYAYIKWQSGNFAANILAKPNIRHWITEDIWLPKAEGYGLGLSFLDMLTYNVRGSAGYGILRPTTVPPPALLPTEVYTPTGRFDVVQDINLPLQLGPVKVVPYGVLDLTSYTNDLNSDMTGRVIGGGGVRASMPFTRLYPDVSSELFNLSGINHKIVVSGNYYIADSNEPYTNFPQLDRLNDDSTDQALRDITPQQPTLNPANGVALATSPIFNPQLYAIRRLVDNRVDTRDDIQVIQADIRQRWQTKRGYPGQQHVIDYVTLDLSGSFFPNPNRDNFGKDFAFLEYDAIWNVGDRTAFVSSGLYDPFDQGARVFTVGAYMNRPDRTNFFLGFRMIDPVDSRALTAAVTYILSPKYALTGGATYDFGINEALSNSLVITRMGSDLTVSFGFTYNALVNNFGFTLEVVPNIVSVGRVRTLTQNAFGTTLFR